MTVIIALVAVVCLLLTWIFVVPVSLVIDTRHDVYRLWQPGTFKGSFIPGDQPRFRMLLFGFELPAGKRRAKPPKPREEPVQRKKRRSRISGVEIRKLLSSIRQAVTVRRLNVNVDTDTMFWNAALVPVGVWLNDDTTRIQSNYQGEVTLDIELRIATHRVAFAIIRFIIKRK